MAQRKRLENHVGDISDDGALDFIFQKAAGELTKFFSLALDEEIAFNAGTRHAYARVYGWVMVQLQDGKSVTAADISAYLQNKLDQLDGDILKTQQLFEQSANKVQLEDNIVNTEKLPEQLANGLQSGVSGDTNGTASASQDQETEINY